MTVVVNYGMGNLRSVQAKLERLRVTAEISSDPNVIARANKLILPGVGSFQTGMDNLRRAGLVDVLAECVIAKKVPILGICLGMQLFTQYSEEGDAEGLGWIPGRAALLRPDPQRRIRVPHVGWNLIEWRKESVLSRGIEPTRRFYFTHSYGVQSDDSEDIVATARNGDQFVAVLQRGNIYGTQFHPEKSHFHGLKLIENFLRDD